MKKGIKGTNYELRNLPIIPFKLEDLIFWLLKQDTPITFWIGAIHLEEHTYCSLSRTKFGEIAVMSQNNTYIVLNLDVSSVIEDIIDEIESRIIYCYPPGFLRIAKFRQNFIPCNDYNSEYDHLFEEYYNKTTLLSQRINEYCGGTQYADHQNLFKDMPFLHKVSDKQYKLSNTIYIYLDSKFNVEDIRDIIEQHPLSVDWVINVLEIRGTSGEFLSIKIEIITAEDYYRTIGYLKTRLDFMNKTSNYSEICEIAAQLNIPCKLLQDEQIYDIIRTRIRTLQWSDFT